MSRYRRHLVFGGLVQLGVLVILVAALSVTPRTNARVIRTVTQRPFTPQVTIPREQPLFVEPLYNRPEVISDADLAAVLKQIRPKFERMKTRPNLVEHALRAWTADAEFVDPEVMSGREMKEFLLDSSKFLTVWDNKVPSLLQPRELGIDVRYGREAGASVHHDHALACLTEAGVPLSEPVFAPGHEGATLEALILEALRDFRPDERETEWTAMAFGLWLPPTKSWIDATGREVSFDLLAKRLMRGHLEKGVCSGTHRVYSLMLLVRLDDRHDILSDEVREKVMNHLRYVRDLIIASQFEDGHWPSNWADGAAALEHPRADDIKKKVIATGHHLEWLSIAPEELHPPREMIEKAADWCVKHTVNKTEDEILGMYTFYSHVGRALAMWRGTQPDDFWEEWIANQR